MKNIKKIKYHFVIEVLFLCSIIQLLTLIGLTMGRIGQADLLSWISMPLMVFLMPFSVFNVVVLGIFFVDKANGD